jgi:signal transduction histidine kinase/ActR/RegA family two-component response regulator
MRIGRALASDSESLEMDLPVLLDNEIWFSIRGRLRQASRQIVGVCMDISELRAAYRELERQKKRADEANRQKTVFLANMSHEIRTPMNGIFGILDIFALQELTSEQRLIVDAIRTSSFQLMRLLDDTLNLTKIEQGEVESNPTVFNLSKLFEPVCLATSSRARLNGLKFNVNIAANFPTLIYGDSQLLLQVLNNLLSNALKFTKRGAISVTVNWRPEEVMVLEVCDTGIGMTPEQQRIIFHHFTQGDASVARFFGGSGLGLALVQEIVSFMEGKITLQSTPGQGSLFTCQIPFQGVMFPYSAPFSDKLQHIVLTMVNDDDLAMLITNVLRMHHYVVKSFSHPDDIMDICHKSGARVEVVVVEGDRSIWPQVKHVVARIPKEAAPKVCSLCEAGETGLFKHTLVKPILPDHLVTFMNGIRYKQQNIEIQSQDVAQDDQASRILVVEDNKTNQFVMKKILQNIGCSFEIAENGREAIDTLEREQFDLVFMDCQMPVLDGLEATRIIRKCGKQYSSIPIVALTASAVEGDEQTCRDAGMDGYLAKPVRIQQIKGVISKFQH